ncbi:hypothetical protein CO151_06260 [bacterium CG_4_9_14_3_um_filter_65_15]|nr:MAG: hypothetical protein CO151_06260 [bacterium CG_4_9_14_3_um_filter_65_15]
MLLVAGMLVASSAFAVIGTDANNIGLFFDTNADVVCTSAPFLTHIPAYIMLTNPSIPATRGFELGMDLIGATNTSVTVTSFPVSSINVGVDGTGGNDINYIVGFSVPVGTTPATILCTLDIFYLDFVQVDIVLGPSGPSSDPNGTNPMIVKEDFTLVTADVVNMPGMPAAQIGAPECTVVAAEDASFGAVKALFR